MTEKYFKIDSFGIYEGDYLHRLDRLMGASTGAMGFYNNMLKMLQKELQE